jgi:hypothetical protein
MSWKSWGGVMARVQKYCIICEDWIVAEFVADNPLWMYTCGHEAAEEGQEIVDRNFGRLYSLEVDNG